MAIQPVLDTAARLGGALRKSERTVEAPDISTASVLLARRPIVALLEAWAEGDHVYDSDDWTGWTDYIRKNKLPSWIRPVYNPVPRAIDWYAGHLHHGTWTEDGAPLPDGTPHVLPIPDDIRAARPGVVLAAYQVLDWSNFRTVLPDLDTRTVSLGASFVEVQDDLEGDERRRKVKVELIPLWQVKDVTLNAGGDVKRYVLEYATVDEKGPFTYRKEVDGEWTRTYRDDKLTDETQHGYGFAPGVWFQSRARGSRLFGVPLVRSVLPKIDRINALIAHTEANIAKHLNQPQLLMGRGGNLTRVSAGRPGDTTQPATPGVRATVTQQVTEGGVPFFAWDAEGGSSQGLLGSLDLGGVNDRIAAQIEEVESDLPEIVLDRELRQMSQVTGPGVQGLVSDVRSRHDEVQANIDAGNIKLMQMGVTMGCLSAHAGRWGDPDRMTRAQKKFLLFERVATTDADGVVTWEDTTTPISQTSFGDGQLSLAITKRNLLQEYSPTKGTLAYEQTRQVRLNVETGIASLSETSLRRMGVDEQDITALRKEQTERTALAETLFNRGAIDPAAPVGGQAA